MNMEERRQDAAKQRTIEAALESLPPAQLCQEAAFALVQVVDGQAWWDIQANTGMPEADARRIRALADVLRRNPAITKEWVR